MPLAKRAPSYDPRELDEAANIDAARKHEILDQFYRLGDLDHYQLLGVPRDADKAAIRKAYFALSKRFHPDTLFGKELGSFKTKMERIFEALTLAYDTLGKKKRRAQYDEYLGITDQTRAVEQSLAGGDRAAEAAAEDRGAQGDTPEEPGVAQGAPSDAATAPTDRAPAAGGAVEMPKVPRAPRTPWLSPAERKAMARQLMERRMRVGAGISEPPPAPSRPSERPSTRQELLESLKGSLKGAANLTGGPNRAIKYEDEAEAAEAAGDRLGAINSLKLALALSPQRTDLQEHHDLLQCELASEMADTYQKQAHYEEDQGNWEAAARSWQKVVEGRPGDARAHRLAAEAILESRGDLHLARDLAQRAVDLGSSFVANHAALVRVFLAAKMVASARKQLEVAAKLDPDAEIVKTLQRELK